MGGQNRIDLTGKRINFLTVIEAAKSKGKESRWVCKCDCGKIFEVSGRHLYDKGRTTRSCRECLYKRITKHGMSKTQENKAWQDMKARCNRPATTGYENYGGRGISYCEEWETFDGFYKDMGKMPSPKHSLERINVNGNYEPSNCKWATRKEQNRNQRSNVVITYKGQTKILIEWSEDIGIAYRTLSNRLRSGWGIEKAFTRPVRKSKI